MRGPGLKKRKKGRKKGKESKQAGRRRAFTALLFPIKDSSALAPRPDRSYLFYEVLHDRYKSSLMALVFTIRV